MNEFILEYLQENFEEVNPLEFYRSIFPLGELEEKGKQIEGKYNAIAVELLPTTKEKETNVKRYLIHNDLKGIEQLLESENFTIISPISYAGKSRISANARYIYALGFDLDGITKDCYLKDLFYHFRIGELPKPTYIVFSGSGLHLYYHFKKPIPCFDNINRQLAILKKALTRQIWNRYTTSLYNNVQYESVFQGFRMVGGITKDGKSRTRAFIFNDKVDIEYLNGFIEEKYRMTNYTYKSRLTLKEAKEKYPEWYEKRIAQKQPKGSWKVKRDLFDWWVEQIKTRAKVGHRYYCVMCLSVYAKKCGIDKEELEKTAFSLLDLLDEKSEQEDNRFTRQDILSALEMYNDNYIRFPVNTISSLTDIAIEKNKRNYRNQKLHLQIARQTRKILVEAGESKPKGSSKGKQKTKDKIVIEWRKSKPKGRKIDCIKETGLSKSTVYKYWNLLEGEK